MDVTLGDALSSSMKDRLHRLRDDLEKQAQQAFANQLAQARPPWRRQRKQTNRPASSDGGTDPVKASPRPAKPAFKYWDFPDEAAVRESPPDSVSDTDKSHLEETLRTGAASSAAGGDDLFVNLGLDFGTSSTKVIVRLPYEAGSPTIAIPAPAACRVDDHPYLWRTVLWLRNDGVFLPWPEPESVVLDSLKQGLIQGRGEKPISASGVPAPTTRAQAGVAHLAFVIRYAKGWLLKNRPDVFRGRNPVWFVNVGMPAESYDDQDLVGPYRRIGAAALQLAKIDSSVTVDAAQRFLDDPHVAEAGNSEESAEELGVAVIPETAAEMTAFAKSTHSADNLYLLVDVGAMTLDVCMFRLKQKKDTEDRLSFMAARVRPLGVDSFYWFQDKGKTKDEFVQQCDRALHDVVWDTKLRRDPRAENWKPGNDVPVFLTGGGARNPLHRDIVELLDPWLKQYAHNDGIRLLELPVPETVDLPEPLQDFGRMAVAWGLSYPPTEIGEIRMMGDIEDIPRSDPVEHDRRFISKDQV